MQHLDHPHGQSHIHLLALQLVRHAVVVTLDLDVVIDVRPGRRELGELIARSRQGRERRLVQLLEELLAGVIQLLDGLSVDPFQQRSYGAVQLVQGEERAAP